MIKSIIFDFGDVFLTLEKSATDQHLKKNGIERLDKDLIEFNKSYEKGLVSTNQFIQHYIEKFDSLSESEFIKVWNSILIEFPEKRLDFLKKIKASHSYQLILLSNTNELHIDWVKENIEVFEEFKSCFDLFYLSHEILFRKPDEEIFEFVLKQNNLKASETLFVDDTLEHIETANKMGIHTWHLKAGEEDVTDLFSVKADLF